jgi:antitoxin component YwqK of YwqJK toxin-antitoxin module
MNRVPSADLFFAEDGLTYHGRDPFTGVGYELRADGSLASKVEYAEGLRSGAARGFYPHGQIAEEVHNLLGVAHGSWREYEKDGSLALEQELEHGILLWERQRGADGELRETYRLREDSPDFEALRGLREVYGRGNGGAQG